MAGLLGAGRGDERLYSRGARGGGCGYVGVCVSSVSILWTEEFEDVAEGACGGGAFDVGGQCRVRSWGGLGWGSSHGEFLLGERNDGGGGKTHGEGLVFTRNA